MDIMKALLILSVLASAVTAFKVRANIPTASLDFAQVSYVSLSQQYDGSWCIKTSVIHKVEGWEHYANGWEVLDKDGKQLWGRPLTHPHVNEQPFTRRLCDIQIPKETKKLIVIAKCNKHVNGKETITVDFTATKGDGYEIKRFD